MAIVVGQHFTTYPAFPGTAQMFTAVCSNCRRIFASASPKNLLMAQQAHGVCCKTKQRVKMVAASRY